MGRNTFCYILLVNALVIFENGEAVFPYNNLGHKNAGLKVNLNSNVRIIRPPINMMPSKGNPRMDTMSAMGGEDMQDLARFLQPNDIGRNPIYDTLPDDGVRCARDCAAHPQKRLCYYRFTAEQYSTMGPACGNCSSNFTACFNPQCVTADGFEKMVLTFNRQIPGPEIHVCYGDRIVVDVNNAMPARELTIHWHGILQQKSPWMDGTPYVAQCPIHDSNTFRYNYLAETTGTHFYHSHESFQIADGLLGAIVIRQPRYADPHSSLYDHDYYSHTILVQDWMHNLADEKFPGYYRDVAKRGFKAASFLIDGLGSYTMRRNFTTPHSVYRIQPQKRYRFRIICGLSLTCDYKISFQNHEMLLIAIDGYPVKPVMVRSLYGGTGSRFDVIISGNQPPSAYWVVVQGQQQTCSGAFQTAVLLYEGSPHLIPRSPINSTTLRFSNIPDYNDLDKGCSNIEKNLCQEHLQSIYPSPPALLHREPDYKLVLNARPYVFSPNELFRTYDRFYLPAKNSPILATDTYNNISCVMPPFNLISQNDPLLNDIRCPASGCNSSYCECVHLYKFRLGDVVQITFLDGTSTSDDRMHHPMHLHGHHFIVLRQGSAAERAVTNIENKKYPTTNTPVIADTVSVPAFGYAVIKFQAINPGFWLLHCHFTWHTNNGMVIILQVGEREQFGPIPHDFPKCNNYVPPVTYI